MIDEALCIARIVEPTSKIDSLRVLADLGIDFFKKKQYFDLFQELWIKNTEKSSVRLVLITSMVKC
jgi:hypothetical protein